MESAGTAAKQDIDVFNALPGKGERGHLRGAGQMQLRGRALANPREQENPMAVRMDLDLVEVRVAPQMLPLQIRMLLPKRNPRCCGVSLMHIPTGMVL